MFPHTGSHTTIPSSRDSHIKQEKLVSVSQWLPSAQESTSRVSCGAGESRVSYLGCCLKLQEGHSRRKQASEGDLGLEGVDVRLIFYNSIY